MLYFVHNCWLFFYFDVCTFLKMVTRDLICGRTIKIRKIFWSTMFFKHILHNILNFLSRSQVCSFLSISTLETYWEIIITELYRQIQPLSIFNWIPVKEKVSLSVNNAIFFCGPQQRYKWPVQHGVVKRLPTCYTELNGNKNNMFFHLYSSCIY